MNETILNTRLHNQGLTTRRFKNIKDAVFNLGAVQSQDFPSALWALSQRIETVPNEKSLLESFNNGDILRTHALRPTWHFVSPKDIRWIVALNAPRVKPVMEYYNKKINLSIDDLKKGQHLLEKLLRDKHYLTRDEIVPHLKESGIKTNSMGYGHVMIWAELDGVICSGPKIGNKFTYALLGERAPKAKQVPEDESLAELAHRYFSSHGPAQIKDFTWWSGLSATQVKMAMEMNKNRLYSEKIEKKIYWFTSELSEEVPVLTAYLLPNYDEFTIAYKDRSLFLPETSTKLDARNNIIFNHSILINGHIVGGWRRELKRDSVNVTITLFKKLNDSEDKALQDVLAKYTSFLEMKLGEVVYL
jgi:hypothetical protein